MSTVPTLVDISHHQGQIDWARVVAAGVREVYLKCTEGVTFEDPLFRWYRKGCEANGLKWSGYHFLRPDSDAEEQAQHFCRVLGFPKFAPVVDFEGVHRGETEDGKPHDLWLDLPLEERLKKLAVFVREVERQLHMRPIIYAGYSPWHYLMRDATEIDLGGTSGVFLFSQYENWCPYYTASGEPRGAPRTAAPWKDVGCAIWQYTSKGQVPGIKGNVDFNVRRK